MRGLIKTKTTRKHTIVKMQEEQINKEKDARFDLSAGQAGWKRWLNYQSIVKQVPFFLFLTLLAVVYIYNGHLADKTLRRINKTEKEVRELKYEYIAVKSKVIFQSKQSELVKSDAIQQLGLKELTESPVVLKDSL
jgi:hypothetical protein